METIGAVETGGVVFRAAGEGPAVWAMGSLFEHKLESSAAVGLSVVTQPAGTATPLHVHGREAEAFYLLDGDMTYQAGDRRFRLQPGGFIYLPKGIPHAFRITGSTPARFLALAMPGAVLAMYTEVGRPAEARGLPGAPPGPEDVARWMEAAVRYGIRVVGPPIPPGDES